MADIFVDYERQLTDWEINALVRRAVDTLSVMEQLGTAFQNLPGIEMAGYEALADAIKALVKQLQDLVAQIKPILQQLDAQTHLLDEKNQAALKALRGLLQATEKAVLLDQITGPTEQGSHAAAAPAAP